MILDGLNFLLGGVLCLLLVVVLFQLVSRRKISFWMLALASGCLFEALLLQVTPLPGSRSLTRLLQGFFVFPACALSTVRAYVRSDAGLSRAATSLGVGYGARIRYVWAPLLRLPCFISSGFFLICLAVSLVTETIGHE